jgi:hypothetical protein
MPGTSTVNWAGADQILSNGATVAVDSAGRIKVYSFGTTHVVIDVAGYVG